MNANVTAWLLFWSRAEIPGLPRDVRRQLILLMRGQAPPPTSIVEGVVRWSVGGGNYVLLQEAPHGVTFSTQRTYGGTCPALEEMLKGLRQAAWRGLALRNLKSLITALFAAVVASGSPFMAVGVLLGYLIGQVCDYTESNWS